MGGNESKEKDAETRVNEVVQKILEDKIKKEQELKKAQATEYKNMEDLVRSVIKETITAVNGSQETTASHNRQFQQLLQKIAVVGLHDQAQAMNILLDFQQEVKGHTSNSDAAHFSEKLKLIQIQLDSMQDLIAPEKKPVYGRNSNLDDFAGLSLGATNMPTGNSSVKSVTVETSAGKVPSQMVQRTDVCSPTAPPTSIGHLNGNKHLPVIDTHLFNNISAFQTDMSSNNSPTVQSGGAFKGSPNVNGQLSDVAKAHYDDNAASRVSSRGNNQSPALTKFNDDKLPNYNIGSQVSRKENNQLPALTKFNDDKPPNYHTICSIENSNDNNNQFKDKKIQNKASFVALEPYDRPSVGRFQENDQNHSKAPFRQNRPFLNENLEDNGPFLDKGPLPHRGYGMNQMPDNRQTQPLFNPEFQKPPPFVGEVQNRGRGAFRGRGGPRPFPNPHQEGFENRDDQSRFGHNNFPHENFDGNNRGQNHIVGQRTFHSQNQNRFSDNDRHLYGSGMGYGPDPRRSQSPHQTHIRSREELEAQQHGNENFLPEKNQAREFRHPNRGKFRDQRPNPGPGNFAMDQNFDQGPERGRQHFQNQLEVPTHGYENFLSDKNRAQEFHHPGNGKFKNQGEVLNHNAGNYPMDKNFFHGLPGHDRQHFPDQQQDGQYAQRGRGHFRGRGRGAYRGNNSQQNRRSQSQTRSKMRSQNFHQSQEKLGHSTKFASQEKLDQKKLDFEGKPSTRVFTGPRNEYKGQGAFPKAPAKAAKKEKKEKNRQGAKKVESQKNSEESNSDSNEGATEVVPKFPFQDGVHVICRNGEIFTNVKDLEKALSADEAAQKPKKKKKTKKKAPTVTNIPPPENKTEVAGDKLDAASTVQLFMGINLEDINNFDHNEKISSILCISKVGDDLKHCTPQTLGELMDFKKNYPNAEIIVVK